VTWTSLGPGTRVPGGWEWVQPEQSPLPKNTVLLRSRGFVPGVGLTDWYVERLYRLPAIFTDNISFGMGVKGFGFLVSGVAGQEVAVQASPDLGDWTSVGTNVITSNAWFYFSDGDWSSQPRRFYRAVTIGPP